MPSFASQRKDASSEDHRGPSEQLADNQYSYEVCERPKQRSYKGPHSWGDRDKVTLLVDGKRFNICPLLLTKQPNTMLGRFVRSLYVTLLCVCVCTVGCSLAVWN